MNLPGLSMVNRVGGAAVAVAWGAAIVFVLVSIVSVFDIPDGWRDQMDDSTVIQSIAGEDAIPRQLFESVAGDNVMGAISALQDLFGSARAVPEGTEVLEIPPAEPDAIRQVRDEATEVVEKLNEYRVGEGLKAVQPVGPMTEQAEMIAAKMYVAGRVSRLGDCRTTLAGAGYSVLRCDSGVALAGTAFAAFDGILETPGGTSVLGNPEFDRVGVAVVEGPTGRLLVVMLGG